MVYYNPSNADIANLYLYGTSTTPTDLADDALIRLAGAQVTIQVDVASLMAGAGRFALGPQSSLVSGFFDQSNPIAAGTYTKAQMASLLGLSNSFYGINVYQKDWKDQINDYGQRVFIWNSGAFKISDDAIFVVDANGNRSVENYAVVPRNASENFDFESSDLIAALGNGYLQKRIDPSKIGRVVNMEYVGSVAQRTYTAVDYQHDLDTQASWTHPSVFELLQAMNGVMNSLFAAGVDAFVKDGLAILYGTTGSDTLYTNTLDDHPYLKVAAQAGLNIVAGAGNDHIIGNNEAHEFKVDGGAGNDSADFSGHGYGILAGFVGVETVVGSNFSDYVRFTSEETQTLQFDGGGGHDLVTFEASASAITAIFADAAQIGVNTGYVFTNVEEFYGSRFNDAFLIASPSLGGSDTAFGVLEGAGGFDVVSLALLDHEIEASLHWTGQGLAFFHIEETLADVLAGVGYPDFGGISEYLLTNGADTINISGLASAFEVPPFAETIAIDGGKGADVFNLDLAGAAAPVILMGGEGDDVFNISSPAGGAGSLKGEGEGGGSAREGLPNLTVLYGGAGVDHFNVSGGAALLFVSVADTTGLANLDLDKLAVDYQQYATGGNLVVVVNIEANDIISLDGVVLHGATTTSSSSTTQTQDLADFPWEGHLRPVTGSPISTIYFPEFMKTVKDTTIGVTMTSLDGLTYSANGATPGSAPSITVNGPNGGLTLIGLASGDAGLNLSGLDQIGDAKTEYTTLRVPDSIEYSNYSAWFGGLVLGNWHDYYTGAGSLYGNEAQFAYLGIDPKLSAWSIYSQSTITWTSHNFASFADIVLDVASYQRAILRYGTEGADDMAGAVGSDQLHGGGGNDILRGNGGHDLLFADAGDDVLNGGAGDDRLDGGLGLDLAYYLGHSPDFDFMRLANGDVVATDRAGGEGQDLLVAVETVYFAGDDTGYTISELAGDYGTEQNDGGLQGTARGDYLYGLAGDDQITGGGANDKIYGGAGFDQANYAGASSGFSFSRDVNGVVYAVDLSGAEGEDILFDVEAVYFAGDDVWKTMAQLVGDFGTPGDDPLLAGTAGNDVLYGFGGDDQLIGLAGDDLIDGGEGFDQANFQGSAADYDVFWNEAGLIVVVDRVGGEGTDYLQNVEALYFAGDDSWFSVEAYLSDFGTASDDPWLAGTDRADALFGFAGDDVLRGGAGNDRIDGGEGGDEVSYAGALSNFTFVRNADGSVQATDATGAEGSDTLINVEFAYFEQGATGVALANLVSPYGSAGSDVLTGTGGQDQLYGLEGDDTLAGGAGDDLLVGSSGADTFVFAVGTGRDTIADFSIEEGDHIRLDGAWGLTYQGLVAASSQVGDDVEIDLGASGTLVLQHFSLANISEPMFLFA